MKALFELLMSQLPLPLSTAAALTVVSDVAPSSCEDSKSTPSSVQGTTTASGSEEKKENSSAATAAVAQLLNDATPPTPPPAEIVFTFVEGLMFLLHQHGMKAPQEMARVTGIPLEGTTNTDAAKYEEFKNRVVYTYEASQVVLTKLQRAHAKIKNSKTAEAISSTKLVERGIASIRNITDLARVIILSSPTLLSAMPSGRFSWQHSVLPSTQPLKHTLDTPADSTRPSKKQAQQTYVPPVRRAAGGVGTSQQKSL
jgi:hypothetical protein